jgi:hypothetical protein
MPMPRYAPDRPMVRFGRLVLEPMANKPLVLIGSPKPHYKLIRVLSKSKTEAQCAPCGAKEGEPCRGNCERLLHEPSIVQRGRA